MGGILIPATCPAAVLTNTRRGHSATAAPLLNGHQCCYPQSYYLAPGCSSATSKINIDRKVGNVLKRIKRRQNLEHTLAYPLLVVYDSCSNEYQQLWHFSGISRMKPQQKIGNISYFSLLSLSLSSSSPSLTIKFPHRFIQCRE